jgi:DNA-binding response OmpR family regulator
MPKNNRKKILIIEDEQTLIKALELVLNKENYSIAVAIDGESGLDLVKTFKPDLVLLDIILPKMNGFEVLKRVKADKKLSKIPVLILSNLGDESDVTKGITLGAVGYLIKTNYKIYEVMAKIRQILNS